MDVASVEEALFGDPSPIAAWLNRHRCVAALVRVAAGRPAAVFHTSGREFQRLAASKIANQAATV
jgi:hypothetical protein